MKSRYGITAALGLLIYSGVSAAAPVVTGKTSAAEPSLMLRSAMQIMRQDLRQSLGRNLRADWARLSEAISDDMRARQVAGGPANAGVKSEP